jgi:hypothetical protein
MTHFVSTRQQPSYDLLSSVSFPAQGQKRIVFLTLKNTPWATRASNSFVMSVNEYLSLRDVKDKEKKEKVVEK